jgi:hypothetical protein
MILAFLSGTVLAAATLTITPTSLPSGQVGVAYSAALAATGGTTPYTWSISAGALPLGLQINSSTGAITGTPTAFGTANFTAKVSDSSSDTATSALILTINPAALTVTTASLPNGTAGTAYSQSLAATGGTGGYTWTVSAGALPQGLTLSTAGAITGTPTAFGTANFTAKVSDSSSDTATSALILTISPAALTVTTASLPNGTAGTAYSQSLAATGGTGGYTWTVSAGTLPQGLTLSTAGAITGTPTAFGTANFTAKVSDSSSDTPATEAFTLTINPAALTVTTASLPNGTVGTAYSQSLTASGGTGGYTWTVSAGALPQGLTLSTAGAITGTPTAFGTANFTAKVSDSSSDTPATKALTLTINPAALTVTTTSLPNGTAGTAYSQSLAATGGTGGYTWTVSAGALPQGLSLSTAGAITGTPTAFGAANFTAHVSDSSSTTATKALTLTINPAALMVTTTSLPNGTVGTAYSQSLAASGGTGGYTWTVSAGTLPQGLTLSTAGAITGTPTAFGTANFTAHVSDSSSDTPATKAFTLTINPAALTVTTASLPNGTVGTAYSQSLTAGGGTGGYTWTVSAGALPQGLTLSTAGAITGTPTAFGTANFTAHVSDSSSTTATKALTLTINPAALTVTTASLPNGTVGTAYSQSLAATGGTDGYTWTVSAGALPQGLTLSTAGAITGTPTAFGTAKFTAQVSDSSSTTATKALTLTINPAALMVTTTSLPSATAGMPYSQPLSASGGTGGYSWSMVSGSLPLGLAFNAGGTIAGTPTTPGSATFTVKVTDSSSATATKSLTVAVNPDPIVVTTAPLPPGTVGVVYSQLLSATGGSGAYSWSITAGSLPPGLSLGASAGTVAGTPTVAGTFSFSLTVTDTVGTEAMGQFSIRIVSPLSITTPSPLSTGSVSAAYSQTMVAAGGIPPYTWNVSSGTLPPGLTLNSSSGAIGGAPTQAGTFTITIQVTDSTSASAHGSFVLTVASGLAIATPPVLPAATSTVPYTVTLEPAGGSSPYVWAVTAGSLPAGLTFNSSGQINGTPTAAGAFTFTAQVADALNHTASKQLSLAVAPPLTITTASALPGGTAGAAYSATIAGSGGTPPYLWTVSGGSLPSGFTLDAGTGALTGTTAASGTFTFTVTLADSAGVSAQKQFTLSIGPGITFTTAASLPNGVAGTPYTFTLGASGGQPPYSWSITNGSLPTGLALNASSGVISGTPTANGTFNFTVQVSDTSHLTTTQVETIVVGLPSVPVLAISGVTSNAVPLQQPVIGVTLSNPFPVDISGQLDLSFTSSAVVPADDPSIQFSSGGRSAAFTIPANSTIATFAVPQLAIQTGSVAGTITLSIGALSVAGNSSPPPTGVIQTVQVPAVSPVVSNVRVTQTAGGFQVQIVALSNTRELTQVTVGFSPTSGSTLGTGQVTIPLSSLAQSWFQGSSSSAYGGQFTLTIPFSVAGGSNSIASASVTLTNSIGNSQQAFAAYP